MTPELKAFRKFVKTLKPVFGNSQHIQLHNVMKNLEKSELELKNKKITSRKKKEIELEIRRNIEFTYNLFKK